MVDFAKNLADFIVICGKKNVVLLSSLDFGRWQQIDTSSGLQIHYLSSTNDDGTYDNCERLGWRRLQEYNPEQPRWKYLSTLTEAKATQEDGLPFDGELEEGDYLPSLPFASLFTFFEGQGVKVTCLLVYCSEGDNMADAFNLAEATGKLLGLSHEATANFFKTNISLVGMDLLLLCLHYLKCREVFKTDTNVKARKWP